MKEKVKQLIKGVFGEPDSPQTEADLRRLVSEIDKLYTEVELRPLEERRQEFIESLRPYVDKYGRDMVNKFSKYWLEKSPRAKKFKFETKDAFNVAGRLATWAKSQEKYSIVNMLKKSQSYER